MMREFCFKHQLLRDAGEQCGQCAAEAGAAQRRDAINVLEARIADQDSEISGLRRQINELEHLVRGARRTDLVLE